MGGTLPAVVWVPWGWQLLDVHVVLVWAREVGVVVGAAVVVVVEEDVVGVAVAVAVAVAVTVELVEVLVLGGVVVPAPVDVVPAAVELLVGDEPPQPVRARHTAITGTTANGRRNFETTGSVLPLGAVSSPTTTGAAAPG